MRTAREPPVLTMSLRRADQLTRELTELRPALLYLPLEEAAAHPEAVRLALEGGRVGVTLPRVCWDREREELRRQLAVVRDLGVTDALVGTLDLIAPAQEAGARPAGRFRAGGLQRAESEGVQALRFCFLHRPPLSSSWPRSGTSPSVSIWRCWCTAGSR